MPFLGECGNGHVGEVIQVDERLAHAARRQSEGAVQDHVEEFAFREVLVEPRRAYDGGFDAGVEDNAFAFLRLRLAAAAEKYKPADALALGNIDEP